MWARLWLLGFVCAVTDARILKGGSAMTPHSRKGGPDADGDLAAVMADLRVLQQDVGALSFEEDGFMTYVVKQGPKASSVWNEITSTDCGKWEEIKVNDNMLSVPIGIPDGEGESEEGTVLIDATDDHCFDENPWSKYSVGVGKGAVMVDLKTDRDDTAKSWTADLLNSVTNFFFDLRSPYGYTENVKTIHSVIFKTQIPYTVCGYVANTECRERIVASRESTEGRSLQEYIVQKVFAAVEPGQSNYYKVTLHQDSDDKKLRYTLKGKDLGSIDVTLCICHIPPPEDSNDEEAFDRWADACRGHVKYTEGECSIAR